MQDSQIPVKFPIPFANAAGPSAIRAIPTPSQIPIQNGAASLTDGFPPNTFVPPNAGGVGPFGQDFNGILNQITQWSRWQQAGAPVGYDATFATAIGGYPKGALIASATFGQAWLCTADNNLTNPDMGGANWQPIVVAPSPPASTLLTVPSSSSPFTVPNDPVTGALATRLYIRMVAGGGGGAGNGIVSSGSGGGNGSNTSFNGITAGAGLSGSPNNGQNGGVGGGTSNGTGLAVLRLFGASGGNGLQQAVSATVGLPPGGGGGTVFSATQIGNSNSAHGGAGGVGAGSNASSVGSSGGGGGGEYVELQINGPLASSYPFVVGAGGVGGAAGSGGQSGSAGQPGCIIVTAYFG